MCNYQGSPTPALQPLTHPSTTVTCVCLHVYCAVQDFLTSAFLLTAKDRFYSRSDFGQLCAHMSDANQHVDLPRPTILKPMELWTGKQVFSVLVRPNTNTRCVYVMLLTHVVW